MKQVHKRRVWLLAINIEVMCGGHGAIERLGKGGGWKFDTLRDMNK